ncbi:MAG: hypothetical protein R3Y28_02135 [Candidatus Gastranaerophilales bacterium]
MWCGFVSVFAGMMAFMTGDYHSPQCCDKIEQEIRYEYWVNKKEAKKNKERAESEIYPSPYMTVEAYEMLSMATDKSSENVGRPKSNTDENMLYVPEPSYKLAKYNNPPGSSELTLNRGFFIHAQENTQGITSPDYSKMVYSAVYYYRNNGSTATDLFVIELDKNKTNLNKILDANIQNRNPVPILSTDKNIDEYATFRTLTPVDFSHDGTKLLVKEKIGNRTDGIWQTNAWVYDFTTEASYNLIEIREAIVYYWRENHNMDLNDKRWDIYPLGFEVDNPERIVVNAMAYTGETPVNLGVWSIDISGTQSRLLNINLESVQVGMNGMKIVQDGFVPKFVTEDEKALQERIKEADEKKREEYEKEAKKKINEAYKAELERLKIEYEQRLEDYENLTKIEGSTSLNDVAEKFEEVKQLEYESLENSILEIEKNVNEAKKDIIDETIDELIQEQYQNLE